MYVNRRDIDCLQYFEKFDAVKNRCKLIEKGKKWNEILIDLILLTSAGQLHVLWQYCFELYSDFTLILKCVRLFWDGLLFQQHGFVIYKLVSNLRIDLKLCVNLSELFSFCNVNHGLKFCPCWTRQVKFVRQTIFHQLRATPSNCTFNFFCVCKKNLACPILLLFRCKCSTKYFYSAFCLWNIFYAHSTLQNNLKLPLHFGRHFFEDAAINCRPKPVYWCGLSYRLQLSAWQQRFPVGHYEIKNKKRNGCGVGGFRHVTRYK